MGISNQRFSDRGKHIRDANSPTSLSTADVFGSRIDLFELRIGAQLHDAAGLSPLRTVALRSNSRPWTAQSAKRKVVRQQSSPLPAGETRAHCAKATGCRTRATARSASAPRTPCRRSPRSVARRAAFRSGFPRSHSASGREARWRASSPRPSRVTPARRPSLASSPLSVDRQVLTRPLVHHHQEPQQQPLLRSG